jgi:hypothetical protein
VASAQVGEVVQVDFSWLVAELRGEGTIVAVSRGRNGAASRIEIEVGGTRLIVNARQLTAAIKAKTRQPSRRGKRGGR